MMIDAVIRELEIIGEAARNLPVSFIEGHPEIPWSRIRRMRNILIHEYIGVNIKVVWDTSRSNLPQLKTFIQSILPEQAYETTLTVFGGLLDHGLEAKNASSSSLSCHWPKADNLSGLEQSPSTDPFDRTGAVGV